MHKCTSLTRDGADVVDVVHDLRDGAADVVAGHELGEEVHHDHAAVGRQRSAWVHAAWHKSGKGEIQAQVSSASKDKPRACREAGN